jgi:UPF0271 protein
MRRRGPRNSIRRSPVVIGWNEVIDEVDQQLPGVPAMRTVDLNSDLGEGFGPWIMGDDAAMLDVVSSANIACGGHASDPETMFRTLCLARDRNINIGAHPSYPDKEGFGRRRLPCTPGEVERFVASQIGGLCAVAALADSRVRYVKPHGALANVATEDRATAEAVLRATRAVDASLAVLAISGTLLERIARDRGFTVYSEVFADRGYTEEGNLAPRGTPGSMIDDPEVAAERLLLFFRTGRMPTTSGSDVGLAADSICIHGDSAHAVAMARHVRAALVAAKIEIGPFGREP